MIEANCTKKVLPQIAAQFRDSLAEYVETIHNAIYHKIESPPRWWIWPTPKEVAADEDSNPPPPAKAMGASHFQAELLNIPRLSELLLRDMLGVAPSCAARSEFTDYHNLGLVHFADRQYFDTDCTEVNSV